MSEVATTEQNEMAPVEQMPQADNMMAVIARAASDPNVDADKMIKLYDLQERALKRNAEMEFNSALANMQAELPVIKKEGKAHNGKFAKLEDIQKAIAPVLTKHGFAITFNTDTQTEVVVTAVLSHRGGHNSQSTITLPKDTSGSKNPVQAIGSSVAYGQRYALKSLLNLNIADELDDDGAGGPSKIITPEQVKTLRAAIDEIAQDIPTFLTAYAAGSLDNFPSSRYKHALNALIKKKENEKAVQNG